MSGLNGVIVLKVILTLHAILAGAKSSCIPSKPVVLRALLSCMKYLASSLGTKVHRDHQEQLFSQPRDSNWHMHHLLPIRDLLFHEF
jgi:hypothetical protein